MDFLTSIAYLNASFLSNFKPSRDAIQATPVSKTLKLQGKSPNFQPSRGIIQATPISKTLKLQGKCLEKPHILAILTLHVKNTRMNIFSSDLSRHYWQLENKMTINSIKTTSTDL
ncbi:hypothetical protein WJU16_11380 [Chitinophaga pollutisoli]|uniref:Uncharacterized protein n=1 Tax=Chitinophaga pollutisoli TaxID=3133966 RepID=A0ABZ2YUZ4_9BACT